MKFWDNKGNIAVMSALTMPMMIGGAGLGVETGYWYYEQVHLQQAADAAVYAAVLEHQAGDTAEMQPSATAAATLNGYKTATDTLTMTWPSATYPGNVRTADISMMRTIPRGFSAIFGTAPVKVHVKATAKYEASSTGCLLALNKAKPKSLIFSGNATMNISGCIVSSNSMAANSIYTQGSSSSTMPCMTTVGGVSLNAGTTFTGGTCTAPATYQPPIADPYKDLVLPTAGACATGNTFTPGKTYCGSTVINKDTVLAAGTYIFSGGKVAVNGGKTLSGTGVTLVFLNGAYLDMSGNPTVNLTAPTTGTYKGMLIIGDRTTSGHTYDFNGTVGSTMTGTIYLPADDAQYSGNISGFNGCTQIVAQTITWIGNSTLNVNCSTAGMDPVKIGGIVYLVG